MVSKDGKSWPGKTARGGSDGPRRLPGDHRLPERGDDQSIQQQHGPLMVFAAVLIVAGINLLAFGLLAEMQVRHYYEPSKRSPYTVGRVIKHAPENEEEKLTE